MGRGRAGRIYHRSGPDDESSFGGKPGQSRELLRALPEDLALGGETREAVGDLGPDQRVRAERGWSCWVAAQRGRDRNLRTVGI